MEDLKTLLEGVEAIRDEESADKIFGHIACELMNNYEIKKGNKTCDFIEIEFYYHSEWHPDDSVYARNTEIGQWFTHLSGVDIAFKSTKEENPAGKVVSKRGGGILIRSIRERETKELICGPLKTMIFLFNHISFYPNNSDDIPLIRKREINNGNSVALFKTERYHISSEKKYRYYTEDLKECKSYTAKPQKGDAIN